MDINTYLHYNNVALIDPAEDFHASCIKQFTTKGYLTPNQLLSLRNWAHSTSTIERLTTELPEQTIQVVPAVVTEPVIKSNRWSDAEVETLITAVENGTTSLEALATMANRGPKAVQSVLYRNADACTIRKGNVIQFNRIPF